MFEITLPLPPSVNESYAVVRGRKILTKNAREWKLTSEYLIYDVFPFIKNKGFFGKKKIKVTLNIIFPDKRKRDQSNYTKLLYDIFTKANVYNDDSQIVEEHIYSKIEKGVREVHIKIEALYV